MTHSPQFLKLVEKAKKHIREIDIITLKKKLDHNEKTFLVDVREDNEWEKGKIPKSIHLGKGIIERDIENTITDKNSEIILYCGGGYRSALAAEVIQQMGYTNVYSLAGGIRAWRDAGYSEE